MKTALLYLGLLIILMGAAWRFYFNEFQPALTFPGLEVPPYFVEVWLAEGLKWAVGLFILLFFIVLLIGFFSGILLLFLGFGMVLLVGVTEVFFPFLLPFVLGVLAVALLFAIAKRFRIT